MRAAVRRARCVVVLQLTVGVTVLGLAMAATALASVRYDVALGDSLAVGVQPNQHGVELRTSEGYSDQLAATERTRIPSLRLVEFGCPGDSTARMITGHGDPAGARRNHCNRSGGSQLIAAERFLRAHRKPGEIALITIDIGANDVDTCSGTLSQELACVSSGEKSIAHDIPIILKGINAAARPGTPGPQ